MIWHKYSDQKQIKKKADSPIRNYFFFFVLSFMIWMGISSAYAQSTTPNIVIPLGQVVTFNVPDGIQTFVLGNSEIAKVVVPPGQNRFALVNAMKAGVTNLLIWTERGGNPINYVIEVSPNLRNEQIVVRIKVLEVTAGSDGKYGIDWSDFVTFSEAPPNAPFRFGLPVRPTVLGARIDTLINERKARLLAQPTLVVLNNKEASFLSGGEVPIAVADQNRINISWKEFGIRLKLKANIEGSQTIQLDLEPEVSSVDKGNSITITDQNNTGSFVIPAFTTRKAKTTLRLSDNESVVIAGLLRNTKDEVVQKFPLLGDIPVLGYLFRSVDFKENRTELVFIVTPTIVRDTSSLPEKNYAGEADVESPAP